MSTSELDGLDLARLTPWFAEHVDGAGRAPLAASLISGGKSNLTFEVTDGTHRWVLRRPPLGHVLPTAHDMAREYRVMRALADTDVPVPATVAFCDDPAVNDATFYVMDRVDGTILRTPADLAALGPDEARRCSAELIDVLARLHRVEPEAVGLGDFGRPEGFLERQVRRWSQQWARSTEAGCPPNSDIDELARRLATALPPSPPPAIVHGDYRLDNVMFDPADPGRIVAVLDWEMSTLGDPLTDLGLLLLYWGHEDAQLVATGAGIDPQAGFFTRDEVIERYAASSGADLTHLDWYEVFAHYKLAVIVAGIHARYLMGLTRGEGFDHMGLMVQRLAASALERADTSPVAALHG